MSDNKVDGSASLVSEIVDYLRERVESPFLMSFFFSWCLINKDFVFYLLLANEKNKYRKLSEWDFSGYFFGFDLYFANSFLYPMIFGLIFALFYSPLSLVISGARYFLMSGIRSFTLEQKKRYQVSYDMFVENKKLLELKEQRKNLEGYVAKLRIMKKKLEPVVDERRDISKISSDFDFEKKKNFILGELLSSTESMVNFYKFRYQHESIDSHSMSSNAYFEAKVVIEYFGTGIRVDVDFKGFLPEMIFHYKIFDINTEPGVAAIDIIRKQTKGLTLKAQGIKGWVYIKITRIVSYEKFSVFKGDSEVN